MATDPGQAGALPAPSVPFEELAITDGCLRGSFGYLDSDRHCCHSGLLDMSLIPAEWLRPEEHKELVTVD